MAVRPLQLGTRLRTGTTVSPGLDDVAEGDTVYSWTGKPLLADRAVEYPVLWTMASMAAAFGFSSVEEFEASTFYTGIPDPFFNWSRVPRVIADPLPRWGTRGHPVSLPRACLVHGLTRDLWDDSGETQAAIAALRAAALERNVLVCVPPRVTPSDTNVQSGINTFARIDFIGWGFARKGYTEITDSIDDQYLPPGARGRGLDVDVAGYTGGEVLMVAVPLNGSGTPLVVQGDVVYSALYWPYYIHTTRSDFSNPTPAFAESFFGRPARFEEDVARALLIQQRCKRAAWRVTTCDEVDNVLEGEEHVQYHIGQIRRDLAAQARALGVDVEVVEPVIDRFVNADFWDRVRTAIEDFWPL